MTQSIVITLSILPLVDQQKLRGFLTSQTYNIAHIFAVHNNFYTASKSNAKVFFLKCLYRKEKNKKNVSNYEAES